MLASTILYSFFKLLIIIYFLDSSIKEEPSESENALPLGSNFSPKDSYTSDSNYSTQLENLLKRKDNCHHGGEVTPSMFTEAFHIGEYHRAKLKYLQLEHKKRMEILDLERECLMLKRDYLKAKLKAVMYIKKMIVLMKLIKTFNIVFV